MSLIRLPLQKGERPIEQAPFVRLGNGALCIPQHYLSYSHTRETVEAIILEIDFDDRYLVFVCEDTSGITLQVGIIGYDNYKRQTNQSKQKLVFGRKWRVEPQLPTSEIIQTVFLALKKAREHEIRELLRIKNTQNTTTPFNNHQDLPLMAQSADLIITNQPQNIISAEIETLQEVFEPITYDGAQLKLESIQCLDNGYYHLDLSFKTSADSQLPELKECRLSLLVEDLSLNTLYFSVMDALLHLSDRYVDETFRYKGFARFSRKNSILAIADLSSKLRNSTQDNHLFDQQLVDTNYAVDETRVPRLNDGPLSCKLRLVLEKHAPLSGILPL